MSPKPILVAYVGVKGWTAEEVHQNFTVLSQRTYGNALSQDYHIILSPDVESNNTRYQVFYDKDFNETSYEELKALIQESLHKLAVPTLI
jgi:hypothetical protein